MLFTSILIGVGIGLLASALIISVYELSTSIIRQRVNAEIPEAVYVQIEKTTSERERTILPKYKAKAYNISGEKVRDIEFEYQKSEYFYNGEKIYV